MLKARLIPTLLLKDGRMIKTRQFDQFRDVGNPRSVAKVYDAQRADELIFLDISASVEQRRSLTDIIASVAEECFIPTTVGGGVRSIDDARLLFHSGADKVAVNSGAVERPELIRELSSRFGQANVVISIDYRSVGGTDEVHTHRGTRPTGLKVIEWAKQVEALGAGEILLTSIDREGTMSGYDLPTIAAVSSAVSIPVIASGGVGTLQDFVDGIQVAGASAVAAASIFHFTDQSIFKGHTFMRQAGIPVRL